MNCKLYWYITSLCLKCLFSLAFVIMKSKCLKEYTVFGKGVALH